MKNNNKTEIVLFSKYSVNDEHQRELVKWLGRNLQPAIRQQHNATQKFILSTLEDSEPIFLS